MEWNEGSQDCLRRGLRVKLRALGVLLLSSLLGRGLAWLEAKVYFSRG